MGDAQPETEANEHQGGDENAENSLNKVQERSHHAVLLSH